MQLQLRLEMNETPDWLTTRKAVIIMKYREKGNDIINFRLITCLPLMWKIFVEILSDKLSAHLESQRSVAHQKLLLEEQKGCRRKWGQRTNY